MWWGRIRQNDRGTTLTDLMVSIVLLAILGAVMAATLISTYRSVDRSDDETRGLADMRTLTERLSRDLRAARGVLKDEVPPVLAASSSQLSLWVDYNADYRLQDAETVTWKLTANGPFQDVTRSIHNGVTTTVARSLVDTAVFTYDDAASPQNTRTVGVSLRYDAIRGRAAGERSVNFAVRLRNVE